MKHKFLWLFILFIATCCQGQSICHTKIEKVLDGDTVKAVCDHKLITVRLGGIDAPEKQQAYGIESAKHLQALIGNHTLLIKLADKDRYGRFIGNLFVGKRYLNFIMVKDGYAWVYTAYKKSADPTYLLLMDDAQASAQQSNRGLWADKAPEPPWDFRKKSRSAHRHQSGPPEFIQDIKKAIKKFWQDCYCPECKIKQVSTILFALSIALHSNFSCRL